MNYKILISILFMSTVVFALSERKNIKKSFLVRAGQVIEINSVSGVNVNVKSWDRDEIKFDLQIKMSSTDDEYEKVYVNDFDIKNREDGSNMVFDLVETDESVGWSFWDIFKLKFGVIVDKDIRGEIFVPHSNALRLNIRYSKIQLSNMTNRLDIIGRGNDIYLAGCDSVNRIENLYGDVRIENCGGYLDLESRSSEIIVKGFTGSAAIDGLYSAITIDELTGNLSLVSRSEEIKIRDIGGTIDLNADYCDIDIKNIAGFAGIVDRGGTVRVNNAGGVFVKGPYSDIYAENIKGISSDTIKIENRSGIINLANATGTVVIDDEYSEINIRQVTGNVNITNARSNTISAADINGNWISRTQYCSLDLRKLNADLVDIQNRSESVHITLKKLPSRIEINNEYAEVDITVEDKIEGDITLDAKYGDIETNLSLKFRQEGSSSFAYGIIGNSKNIINILTRSGDIKFREY